ncbi:MAG: tetratricopeptide repeat protein [Planctomycetes bacterium]|nr:tetratricopeptide repeat protein [Planctomycetota bacterium]
MSARPRRRLVILCAVLLLTGAAAAGAYHLWRKAERQELADLCRKAARREQWNDLEKAARRWKELEPASGDALLYLGQAAEGRSAWGEALEFYCQVPDSDRQAVTALLDASSLAFGPLNDPLRGVEIAERVVRIDPGTGEAQKRLIMFYAATMQRARVAAQIRSAIQARSEPREAYPYYFLLFTLRPNDAPALVERWRKRYPEEETFIVAEFLLQPEPVEEDPFAPASPNTPDVPRSEREKSRLLQVDRLLARYPQNIELLAYKASLCIATSDVPRAVALLSQVPKAARDDARFWALKGFIHESNQEFDAARQAYRQALELHPADWRARSRLAVIERQYRNLDEVKKLTDLVERSIELRRELPKAAATQLEDPSLFLKLVQYYHDCGDSLMAPALERRIDEMRRRK